MNDDRKFQILKKVSQLRKSHFVYLKLVAILALVKNSLPNPNKSVSSDGLRT